MTEGFGDSDLTRDAFLGGLVQAWQPRLGYRAATDPVFLAASVPARAGERVLELGCGVGVAALCLQARVPGLHLTGVELQAAYADLARRNAQANGAVMDVVQADLTGLPPDLRAQRPPRMRAATARCASRRRWRCGWMWRCAVCAMGAMSR